MNWGADRLEKLHIDADEMRRFLALTQQEQLLEIWLNGRETNGAVAEVQRQLAEVRPQVERHEFWFRLAAVAIATVVAAGPFVFFVLEHLLGG